jgi:hypothetical protein
LDGNILKGVTMNIKPKNNHVVFVKDERNHLKKESSIISPRPNHRGLLTGVIKFIDPNISDLEVGDRIVLNLMSCANQFKLDGELFFTIHYDEILGKLIETD